MRIQPETSGQVLDEEKNDNREKNSGCRKHHQRRDPGYSRSGAEHLLHHFRQNVWRVLMFRKKRIAKGSATRNIYDAKAVKAVIIVSNVQQPALPDVCGEQRPGIDRAHQHSPRQNPPINLAHLRSLYHSPRLPMLCPFAHLLAILGRSLLIFSHGTSQSTTAGSQL